MLGSRAVAGAVVVGVLAALVSVGVASPAAAAEPFVVSAGAGAPDFTPSSGGVKKYMLNTLGKVLGKAMPKSWQAEQIANQYQYNHSWEAAGAAVNGTPAFDPRSATPSSYDDYLLQGAEDQFKPKTQGGKSGNVYSLPATKPGKLGKVIGGAGAAITAITGLQLGIAFGHGIVQALGVDPDGVVCSSGAAGFLSVVTGADCSGAVNTIPPLDRNSGVSALASYGDCGASSISNGWDVSGLTPDLVKQIVSGVVAPDCAAGQMTDDAGGPVIGVGAITAVDLTAGVISVTFSVDGSSPAANTGALSAVGYCGDPASGGSWIAGGMGHALRKPGVVSWDAPCGSGRVLFLVMQPAAGGASVGQGFGARGFGVVWVAGTLFVGDGSDPERVITCTVHGSDGQDYSQATPSFKETDESFPTPTCAALPDGVTPETVTFTEDGGGQHDVLSTQAVTDAYKEQQTDFPGCADGACEMLLNKIQADGTYKDCTDLGTDCKTWFNDDQKASEYRCTFGGETVELEQCNVYAGLFDPARVAAGAPYSDPVTGEWSGGQSAPSESSTAYGQGVQSPVGPRTCDGTSAGGFDPIAWVMRPVQCALEWAFVPEPVALQVSLSSLSTAWDGTSIAGIGAAVGGWHVDPAVVGCSSEFDFPVSMVGEHIPITILNTCPGTPLGSVAPFVRGIVSITVAIGAAFAVKSIVARWVDYS